MPSTLAVLLTLAQPIVWAHIDADSLKGRPARLAWSEDRSELYLQVVDGQVASDLTFSHYLIRQGRKPEAIAAEPRWVQPYWSWKSAKSFFGDPLLTITVDVQQTLLDNLNGTAANRVPTRLRAKSLARVAR